MLNEFCSSLNCVALDLEKEIEKLTASVIYSAKRAPCASSACVKFFRINASNHSKSDKQNIFLISWVQQILITLIFIQ